MSQISNLADKEQQVFEFLANNPDFLERHPNLLSHITVPHEVEGGVSLVERQVKVLREKNRDLQSQLIEMLKAAEQNEQLLVKCIRLTLCMVDCNSLQELTNTLQDLLKREFVLDDVVVSLGGRWQRCDGVKVHADIDKLQEQLECHFPDDEPVCGRLDRRTAQIMFPHIENAKGSVALLPLGKQGQYGILSLYSRDEQHFSPEQGYLFLQLISSVTTQMLLKFKDF